MIVTSQDGFPVSLLGNDQNLVEIELALRRILRDASQSDLLNIIAESELRKLIYPLLNMNSIEKFDPVIGFVLKKNIIDKAKLVKEYDSLISRLSAYIATWSQDIKYEPQFARIQQVIMEIQLIFEDEGSSSDIADLIKELISNGAFSKQAEISSANAVVVTS